MASSSGGRRQIGRVHLRGAVEAGWSRLPAERGRFARSVAATPVEPVRGSFEFVPSVVAALTTWGNFCRSINARALGRHV